MTSLKVIDHPTKKKAYVLLADNPFKILNEAQRFEVNPRTTPRQWLASHFGPDFTEFPLATVCQVNGDFLMRKQWHTYKLKAGDVLTFVALPGDPVSIVIAVIAVIVAVAAVLLMPDPMNPSEGTETTDPVYTLRGQTNQLKLGEPIEVTYGRCRIWPSYGAPPYSKYKDNQQRQMSLFCVGPGTYEIDSDEIFLEDTAISTFDDVTLEIIPPGGTITLFKSNVFTAAEVTGFELFAPNQTDPGQYPAPDGWYGGYVVNPSGTIVDSLEIDVTCPNGLFTLVKGLRQNTTVNFQFQYQKINSAGVAVGAWTDFGGTSLVRATQQPQRLTYAQNVDPGRYQVRGRRTNNKALANSSRVDTLQWESVRGLSSMVNTFGNHTMIAMDALATNSLNNNTRQRFNLYVTRKLRKWDTLTGTWTAPVATRNPVWAMCDLMTDEVYGGRTPTKFLAMDDLYTLANILEDRGDWFDWVFDQSITIWEAAKTIMRPSRCAPIPQGSLVTAIRDVPKSLPNGIFNQLNIVKGSVRKQIQLAQLNDFDSLNVEYTDPETWKPEQVTCTVTGTSNNPDTLKLVGCTDRDRAYREGMLIEAKRKRCRTTVIFQTGTEGNVPSYMDLCFVSYPSIRIGRGGAVLAYNAGTKVATLSDKVVFAPGYVHKLVLRNKYGAINGDAITVTAGTTANQVILAHDPVEPFDFNHNKLLPLYTFGIEEFVAFKGNLVKMQPSDSTTVELTLLNYDESVYQYDEEFAPPLGTPARITDPTAPVMENVVIATRPDDAQQAIISWKPANGARGYIIEQQVDGVHWERIGEVAFNVYSFNFTIQPGDMKVRVSAKGASRGGWYTTPVKAVGIEGTPPASPVLDSSLPPFTGLSVFMSWQPAVGAVGYSVETYLPDGVTLLRDEDVGTAVNYTYDITKMLADHGGVPSRDLIFRIVSYNTGGDSTPKTNYSVSNTRPPVVTTPAATLVTGLNYNFTWDALSVIPADFKEYRVYGSTAPGFIPGPANMLYHGAAANCNLTLPSTPFYWRACAVDQWAGTATSADINYTTEQTI